jgi:Holliday junction resolvase-like predicted endonuclease
MLLKNGDQRQSIDGVSKESGNTSFSKGLWAEELVSRFFQKKGFNPCSSRIKLYGAEVDLVLEKNQIYYFIEVKCLGENSSLEGRWSKAQKTRFLRMANTIAEISHFESRFLFVVVHYDKTIEVFNIEEILG